MLQSTNSPLELPLSAWKLSRLNQLLLLVVTVAIYSVVAMAIGNSLFVTYVGAKSLPVAFMLIGIVSIPAYTLFSQVVDRFSRPLLFRYILAGSIALVIGIWLLLGQGHLIGYYLLLIFVFFQWDFHNKVLYPSLLTDYFTTLEYKQYAPYISVAQAVGILLGGGLTTILAHYFPTRNLLLGLPVIFAIGIAQLLYLESSQGQVSKTTVQPPVGTWESLRSFPELVQRYPLALLLAGSSFLMVIIYLSSEFLWFSIYGQNFTDQTLTSFLGLMRILISFVQVAVVYGFTRPSLQRLGVAQMNVIYPTTTLLSLLGLIWQFNLPAAIGLHINGDALYKAINSPVHQLNYNAIPREFIPRIRTLCDGLIYAIGLTLVGLLLWLSESLLSLQQVTWVVVGLTVLLLLVRWPMGKFYGQGLENLIRSNGINLDDLDRYPLQLSDQSSPAIQALLADAEPYIQSQGLALAARIGQPREFLSAIDTLMIDAVPAVRDAALALFANCDDATIIQHFEQLLSAPQPRLQEFALEVLTANEYRFDRTTLQALEQHDRADIRILAQLATVKVRSVEPAAVAQLLTQLDAITCDADAARLIVRIVQQSGNRALVPLLQHVLEQDEIDLAHQVLAALAALAQPADAEIATIAAAQTHNPNIEVRIAAYKLLELTRCDCMQKTLIAGFSDPEDRVRQAAAIALAAYGESSLGLAKAQLTSTNPLVVNAAIAAIGQVRTKPARHLLYDYLAPDFQLLAATRKWQPQLPMTDERWQPLVIAIEDYQQRLLQKVLYVLSALGYGRIVNAVKRLLATSAAGDLANAVEALASLRDRRFVSPLLPLLEQMVQPARPIRQMQVSAQWFGAKGYRLLLEALESGDRWLRSGALIALASVPSALVHDRDPVVRLVAGQIFGGEPGVTESTAPQSETMNRLLLLKDVALFRNLSLDELLLIDQGLEQVQVLAGQTIFAEGDSGYHLFIMATGRVKLVKLIDGSAQDLQRLGRGQYFGEVALFDDAPRWNGAIALEDCTLLKLEKQRFLSLVSQKPHIILEICRFLSQRLRETDRYRLEQRGNLSQPEGISR